MYPNVPEGNNVFVDRKIMKSSELYYLQPSLFASITDIVEAMNNLIQERQNHSQNCITGKAFRRTQKVKIHFANERSGLAFFGTDLAHIFGSNDDNGFGVMLRGKGTHKPETAYSLVRIHSLMIYTVIME